MALKNTQGVDAALPYWQEALRILADLGLPQADEVRDRLADAGRTRDEQRPLRRIVKRTLARIRWSCPRMLLTVVWCRSRSSTAETMTGSAK